MKLFNFMKIDLFNNFNIIYLNMRLAKLQKSDRSIRYVNAKYAYKLIKLHELLKEEKK